VVYGRRVKGETLVFGVSGYLYRNAVLFHDEQTETFWSQMTGAGVVGTRTGTRLKWLPCTVTTWKEWRAEHPETTVLRPLSGDPRFDYRGTEEYYARYRRTGRWMFPMPVRVGRDYKPMELLTIVPGDRGGARGYPHRELGEGATTDGSRTIVKKGATVTVWMGTRQVPSITGYWFAWCAFYEEEGGTVYKRPR